MSENVTQVDFGKEQRESARKFSRLMGLAQEREDDILRNPKKYLDEAHDEIVRLRLGIEAMRDALRAKVKFTLPHAPLSPSPMHTITVPQEEYERMKAALAILKTL